MAKKKRTTKSKGKSKAGFYGAAIALIVILGAIYVGQMLDTENTPTGAVTADGDEVLVSVNGVDITTAELDLRYRNLPPNLQAFVTKESLLDELIVESLLHQEANNQDIDVTEAEVQEQIELIKVQQGLTEEQIDEILVSQGQSLAGFREELFQQIKFQKLFDLAVEASEPSEEDVLEAYETLSPGVVQHILITPELDEEDEALQERTDEIFEMIEDDFSNYCDLVTEFSQDPGSIASCGEYEVFRGSNFVPEFEEAGLRLLPGEVEIVSTQFGNHILYKIAETPLEDVEEEIISTLQLGDSRVLVDEYIADLREQASIVYPTEEAEVDDDLSTLVDIIEIEDVVENIEDMEEEAEEVVEEVIEEEMETEEVEEAPDVQIIPEIEFEDIEDCLDNVKLYGAFWDSQTKKQLNVFDETPEFYTECFEGSYKNLKAECEDIAGFPTWQIEDKEYLGFMSLNTLKNLAGCEQ